MFFLKSGDLFWNGMTFQTDCRKAIVYGSVAAACEVISTARRAARDVEVVALTPQQWGEHASINGGS